MTMMKCGHAAQGVKSGTDEPVCVACYGIDPGATIIDDNPPSLEEREAICHYRYGNAKEHGKVASSSELAFFEHRPKEKYDTYYCGCSGWDGRGCRNVAVARTRDAGR